MAVINDTRNLQDRNMSAFPRKLDKSSLAQIGLSYVHHEVHDGKHFFLYDTANIASSGSRKTYAIQTPDTTTLAHMLLDFSANGYCLVEFGTCGFEAGFTPTLFKNNRLGSANTSETAYEEDAAIINFVPFATARIGRDGTPPASGNGAFGASGGTREEFILARNQAYAIRFTAGMDDVDVNLAINFYEHADKF